MYSATRVSSEDCLSESRSASSTCAKTQAQKVHVWGGISSRRATAIVLFTGIMNATHYTDILDASLVPFIREYYPHHHRLQQDNDPKHTSRWAQSYFTSNRINWWRTSPSSPDLNPIENVWGSTSKSKQTNLEFQLQQLARKERGLATSTPVRAKPTTETVVELPAEPTTSLRAQPKVLALNCEPVIVPTEEIKSPLDTSANRSGASLISTDGILRFKQASISRKNLAVNMMRKMYDESERRSSNVRGKAGKDQLYPERMVYIKKGNTKVVSGPWQ